MTGWGRIRAVDRPEETLVFDDRSGGHSMRDGAGGS